MRRVLVADGDSIRKVVVNLGEEKRETTQPPPKTTVLVAAGGFPPGSVTGVLFDTIQALRDYHFLIWVRNDQKDASIETLRRLLEDLGDKWPTNFHFLTSPASIEKVADQIKATFFHLPTGENWIMRFSLERQIRIITFSHSVSYFEDYPFVSSPSAPKVAWQRRAFLLADKIVCWSNLEKEMIFRFFPIVRDKIRILPLCQRLSQHATGPHTPPSKRQVKVLFAGRPLAKRKGFEYLARALHKLTTNGYRVELTVADAFTDATHLAKARFSDVLQGVATKWLCDLNPERMRQLYQSTHVVVIPSLYDSWCKVLTEAVAEGTPVIATDATGATELFPPDEVPRVEAGDSGAIAAAIEDIVADYSHSTAATAKARARLRRELTPEEYAVKLRRIMGEA